MTPQQKWNKKHSDKLREATKRHREKYPERVKDQNVKRASYKKNRWLKAKYKISLEEWEQLLLSQNNVCAICGTNEPKSKGWQTDHCHKTGKVRGILCAPCNWLLGDCKDSIPVLEEAIKYLGKHNG